MRLFANTIKARSPRLIPVDRPSTVIAPGTAPRPAARRARPWIVGIALFICILSGYLLSYNVDQPAHNGDWYLRYQVACSIVEHNRFSFVPYRVDARTGPGVSGRMYSQYTLGQSVALIPLYLLGRTLAGLPHTDCDTRVAPPIVFLTAKLLDPLLGALLCVLFFATARLLGYRPRLALALSLLLAFGTALWPDVLSNLEHTQESLFLLAAAYAALRYTLARRPSRLWVLVMGLAAGLVFVTRLTGIIALPIFALYLVVLHRRRCPAAWKEPLRRDLALYAAGAAPSVAVNAAFNALRFGSPLRAGPHADHSFIYPPWQGLPSLLISPGKGLLWYVPALWLLLLAARPFWRRHALPARLCALICGLYLLFYANVTYWHGDPAWGPRYLYAALPYLVLPLGEVWRRWRSYRLPVRGVLVGVLAASFLVQLSAVSVSYWRQYHVITAYHLDQIERHDWGFNMNYFWKPEQSPIVISLQGIAAIVQNYVDHAPLLQHPANSRLGNADDPCVFQVYGRAYICVAPADDLRYRASWNTFTLWWTHTYPWWSEGTVIVLALALAAIFLGSGALLVGLTADGRPLVAASRVARRDSGRARPMAVPLAAGLLPLGRAACIAGLVYDCIVGVAAARAPHSVPPLIQTVSMNRTVTDGGWSYRVLGITRLAALPGTLEPPAAALGVTAPYAAVPGISASAAPTATAGQPAPGAQYVVVRLLVRNLLTRPDVLRTQYFALTDGTRAVYPWVSWLNAPAAELYHLADFGSPIPARSAVETVLVYLARHRARDLALLAPGITLVRLQG